MSRSADQLRVAILDPLGWHGGMHYYVQQLAAALCPLVDVSVYTSSNSVVSNKNYRQVVCFDGIFGKSHFMLRGLIFIRELTNICFDMIKNKINVVHMHCFDYGLRELIMLLCLKISGFSVVTTIHDVQAFGRSKGGAGRKIVMHISDSLIVHNEFCAELIEQYSRRSKSKLAVVPHPPYFLGELAHNMNRDSARDFLKLRKDVVLALFFGNPRAEKGLDVLLKAFTDMAKKEEHKLLIAGKPGKSAEQDARLFGELPYGVLDIRRHLDDHETIAAFLAADFLVMPYLRVYESGVSLMALSLGRYVVASSLDPFISVLGGGEFGLLAEPGSVDDLKAKMTKAFSMSRNERDTIGQLGQSATFEKRGLSEIGRRTAESYRFALGKADV